MLNKYKIPLLTIFSVLFIDQFIKIYIKLHYPLGEITRVAGDWFILHFTENPGMAFGMEFGGHIPAGTQSHEPISSIDFYPTLLEVAGAKPPANHTIDGVSIAAIFRKPNSKLKPRDLAWYSTGNSLNDCAVVICSVRNQGRSEYKG